MIEKLKKYEHFYTAYCKEYVIYADLESINKKIRDEYSVGFDAELDKNFAEVVDMFMPNTFPIRHFIFLKQRF